MMSWEENDSPANYYMVDLAWIDFFHFMSIGLPFLNLHNWGHLCMEVCIAEDSNAKWFGECPLSLSFLVALCMVRPNVKVNGTVPLHLAVCII